MVLKIGCDVLQLIEEKVLVVGLNKATNINVSSWLLGILEKKWVTMKVKCCQC